MTPVVTTARGPSGLARVAIGFLVTALLLGMAGLPVAAAAIAAEHRGSAIEFAHPALPGPASAYQAINLTDTPSYSPRFGGTPGFPLVNASTNLTLHLANVGLYDHTFTLLKQPGVKLNGSWTPFELDHYFNVNGSLANVSLAAGQSVNVSLAFNASVGGDSFEFVSVVPYQFQAGMFGFLNFSAGAGLVLTDNATNNLQFVPSLLAVANVTKFPVSLNVEIMNTGALGHTWTLSSVANATLLPSNFTTYFQTHPPLANALVPPLAGGTVWANFTVGGIGIYQYICTVQGHFAAGMTGFLYVGVPPPPPAPPQATGVVQAGVLVGTAILIGIGVALALVASFTGRFPRGKEATPPEHAWKPEKEL